MLLDGTVGTYDVSDMLAATAAYRVYLARDTTNDTRCLLQIATKPEANGGLERAAFILGRFKKAADAYDVEYAKTHERKHLHHDRLYPAVVESFVSSEQGDRRVTILNLTDVKNILAVVPLSNLRLKDRLRIDPETSAWIMGRLLKLLNFTHGEGVLNGALTARNVLLHPEQHFAMTLDWSVARVFPGVVPAEFAVADIASAATAVFEAIGGDATTGMWPYDDHVPYVSLLRQLMHGRVSDASSAHDQFYELVRAQYGNEFHPFTTLPLTERH